MNAISNKVACLGTLIACLSAPIVALADADEDAQCRHVRISVKQGPPAETCAFDLCGTAFSTGGLGKGTWHSGLNLTDITPLPAPIPDEMVFAGSSVANFEAKNGDVFFGHSAFVAAPERPNISGAIYFMKGGTGKFANASARFVDVKGRDESQFRLVGEVCGLSPRKHSLE